ncbi:MAG: 3-dehydroquinate synthase [Nitriliruptoraceae bacterium]
MTRLRTIDVPVAASPYRVVIGENILADLGDVVDLPAGVTRALVVTQDRIAQAGYVDTVERALSSAGIDIARHGVPDGEQAKDVAVLHDVWRAAAGHALSRRDVIVAVGGGVVGDLAGFAAATYNRGIGVLHVPTTLLAQVDAAIGGKTGINLPEGKNLVGAFHQPLAVLCDVAVLRTLDERTLTEGFGEIVKYGFIADEAVLDRLESAPADGKRDAALLIDLVHRSVAVKAAVVAADEREVGARAFLNFGHTVGHAIETLTGYGTILHGEAVAIGMVAALKIGVAMDVTPAPLVDRAQSLLGSLGLPVRPPSLPREAMWQIMARDKKADANGVRFVVLEALGDPTLLTPHRALVDAVLDELATA